MAKNRTLTQQIDEAVKRANPVTLKYRALYRVNKWLGLGKSSPVPDCVQTILGEETFGESFQDLFVIKMTQGLGLDQYVEIGSGPPTIRNNTYALEKNFAWKGISLEYNNKYVVEFLEKRINKIYEADATTFDYESAFLENNFSKHMGYLQVDIDPSYQSLACLPIIPFSKRIFAVITFEHDAYRSGKKIAKLQRQYLESLGYKLIFKNVHAGNLGPYEDWWIHPQLVPKNRWENIFASDMTGEEYFSEFAVYLTQ